MVANNMQQLVRQELLKLLLEPGKKDITPAGPYQMGPGGNLTSLAGLNRDFISLVIQPDGIWGDIPSHPSMFMKPEFGYITGFTAPTGSQPTDACGDGPIPGSVVTCIQTAHYGRYRYDTKPIEINNIGKMVNRNDPVDFNLMNGPLFQQLVGTLPGGDFGDYASNIFNPKGELFSRMGDVAREYWMLLSKQLWEGSPKAVSDTTSAGSDEFPGLDMLIGTNKIDSRTGTPCPLLDSDIKDFGYRNISENGGLTLFNALYYIVMTRRYIARRTNMGRVVWKFAMKETLFEELCKLWPCIYATFGCLPRTDGGVTPVINLDNQRQMAEDMRNGLYLPIGGNNYPVVIDDALAEEGRGSGSFASDIMFLPYSVRGGYEVLFREYVNMNVGVDVARQAGFTQFSTDNGEFLWWTKPNNNVCIQLGSKTEQRVVLLTPQLAGRLNSVTYSPLQHVPDPFRGDLYYDASGQSNRGGGVDLYSDWNLVGPGTN